MLLRLWPGLTVNKSLDQTQRGIKLAAVHTDYSMFVGQGHSKLAGQHAGVSAVYGCTITYMTSTVQPASETVKRVTEASRQWISLHSLSNLASLVEYMCSFW